MKRIFYGFAMIFLDNANAYQCWEVKRLYNSLKLQNGDYGCCGKPNATIDEHSECTTSCENCPSLEELGYANRYFNYQDSSWSNMDLNWKPSFTQTANMQINDLYSVNVPQYRENSKELYTTTTHHAVISKQLKTWGTDIEHIKGAIERNFNWLSKNGINFNNPLWSARNNDLAPHIFRLNSTQKDHALVASNDFVDSSWLYASYTFESGGSNPLMEGEPNVCPPVPAPEKLEGGTVEIYLKPEYSKKGVMPTRCKLIISFYSDSPVTQSSIGGARYNQVIVHDIPIVTNKTSGNQIVMSDGSIHLHVESLLVQHYKTDVIAELLDTHTEIITKHIDIDIELASVYIDRKKQTMHRTLFQNSNALIQEESTHASFKVEIQKQADCQICDKVPTVVKKGTRVPSRNVHKTDIYPEYYNGVQFELFGKGYPHGTNYNFWSVNGMFDNGFTSFPSVFSTFADNLVTNEKELYAGAGSYLNVLTSPVSDSFGRNGNVKPSDKVLLGPDIMVNEGLNYVQYSTYGALMGHSRKRDERSEGLRKNSTQTTPVSHTRDYFTGFGSEATAIYAELMSDSRVGDLLFQQRGDLYSQWIQGITYGQSLKGTQGFFGRGDYMSWPMYVFLGSLFDKDIPKGPYAGDKLRTLIKNLYAYMRSIDNDVLKELGQYIHLLDSYEHNPITQDLLSSEGIPEYLQEIEPFNILDKVVKTTSNEVGLGDNGLSEYFDQLVVGTVLMANKESAPQKLLYNYSNYCYDDEVPFSKVFSNSVETPKFDNFLQLAEQAFSPNNIPFEETNLTPHMVAVESENNWKRGRIMEKVISGELMMNLLNKLHEDNGEFEPEKEYSTVFPLKSMSAYCFGIGRGFQATKEEIEAGGLVYPPITSTAEIQYLSEKETHFDMKVMSEECPLCELKGVKYSVFSRTMSGFEGYLGKELIKQDYVKIEDYDDWEMPQVCITNSGSDTLVLHMKAVAPLEICPLGLCKD